MAELVNRHSAEFAKSSGTEGQLRLSQSRRYEVLVPQMEDKEFRDSYVITHTRQFLAKQFRAFRGDLSQAEFGEKIDQKQSAVSRLEDPNYGRESLQTLFDAASKLGVAVLVRFVDFKTFLKSTGDVSEAAVHPKEYDQTEMEAFVQEQAFEEAISNVTTLSEMVGLPQNITSKPYAGDIISPYAATYGLSNGTANRTLHWGQSRLTLGMAISIPIEGKLESDPMESPPIELKNHLFRNFQSRTNLRDVA